MDRSQKLSFPHENEIRMGRSKVHRQYRTIPATFFSQKAFGQHSAWMAEHHPRGHRRDGLAQAVVRSMNQHVGEPTTVSASVPKWRNPVSASSQSTSDTFSRSGVGTIVAAPSDIHTTCPPASVFNCWANQSARSHSERPLPMLSNGGVPPPRGRTVFRRSQPANGSPVIQRPNRASPCRQVLLPPRAVKTKSDWTLLAPVSIRMGFDERAEPKCVLLDIGLAKWRRVLHLDGADHQATLVNIGRVHPETLSGSRTERQ